MRIEAAFDCLTITALVQEFSPGPSKGDVHLLAYLASLLAVYARRGEGASDWGYAFTATPSGAPFSDSLEVELEWLVSSGALLTSGTSFRLTESGRRLQDSLSRLSLTEGRFSYLDSASATVLAMPVGLIRAAFSHDPDLSIVAQYRRARSLMSKSALVRLFLEFNAVAEVLGPASGSLLAASVLWLSYLLEQETASYTA